jgi:hypothetical protein
MATFNVVTYGATGNGTTNDTSSINTAIAAAVAYVTSGGTNGCLYFPAGTYYVTSSLSTISIASPYTLSIKGDGRLSSIIYQTSASANGLSISIAQASGGAALASVEVFGLGFQTSAQAASALYITYGTSNTASTEYACGLTIYDINIQGVSTSFVPGTSSSYG